MTDKQEHIFFALLRRALFQDDYDKQLFQNDDTVLDSIIPEEDWKPVLTSYLRHALLGVVAYSFKTLPKHLQPSLKQSDRIISYTWQQTKEREKMHAAIAQSFNIMEKEGATPILLKGEGLASLYPNQSMRAIGDVDALVDETHFDAVCMAIDRAGGIEPDRERYYANCEHHYHTTFNGTELEIHHCIADESWDSEAKRLNQWAEDELQADSCRHIMIGDKQILLPPVQFDIFYIFQHLCKHVLNEGGGLRQIVDWGLYLHTVYTQHLQYDEDALYKILKDLHYLHPWQVLSGILHFQLGMPTAEIPFYNKRKALKSQGVILADIVDGGNFGKDTRDNSETLLPHGFRRTLFVLRSMFNGYRKKRILFPHTAFVTFYKNFVIGIRCRMTILRNN